MDAVRGDVDKVFTRWLLPFPGSAVVAAEANNDACVNLLRGTRISKQLFPSIARRKSGIRTTRTISLNPSPRPHVSAKKFPSGLT